MTLSFARSFAGMTRKRWAVVLAASAVAVAAWRTECTRAAAKAACQRRLSDRQADDRLGRFHRPLPGNPERDGDAARVGRHRLDPLPNGEDVKSGQPLFIIDPRPFRAAYDQAVADLDNASATEANARANFGRGKALLGGQRARPRIVRRPPRGRADRGGAGGGGKGGGRNRAAQSRIHHRQFAGRRAHVRPQRQHRRHRHGEHDRADPRRHARSDLVQFRGRGDLPAEIPARGKTGPTPFLPRGAQSSGYPARRRNRAIRIAATWCSWTTPSIRSPGPSAPKAEFSNADHFLTPGMFGRARLLASGAYQAAAHSG